MLAACVDGDGAPAEGAAPASTLGTDGDDDCADTGAALASTLGACGDGGGEAATGEASA
jgi:hypothetical protein